MESLKFESLEHSNGHTGQKGSPPGNPEESLEGGQGLNFASDNVVGACPEIMQALSIVNNGAVPAYGEDPVTQSVARCFDALFETSCSSFPVATGTAANALALSVITPPYGAVICHSDAHIHVDEAGAPELFSGGAKLLPLDGPDAKLQPEKLQSVIDLGWKGDVHHPQPAAVSITQITEQGSVYSLEEIQAIGVFCRAHGLFLHMDGARFGNAIAALDCTPAEMTWRLGVDVLSFGATKNGAFAAEAVVFFNQDLVRDFTFRRKRGGHLVSKMRFISAQLDGYLTDEVWLKNAKHANAMALLLVERLETVDGAEIISAPAANEAFVSLNPKLAETLQKAGVGFYDWPPLGENAYRFVTSWATDRRSIDRLVEIANAAN